MKQLFLLAMLSVALLNTSAQKSNWKEMQDFHSVMSITFHSSEDNNLKPTKDSSNTLLKKAIAWQNSKVPAGYKAQVAKPILKKLVSECEEITNAVKHLKSDAELKILITKLHDTFHEITEKCTDEKKN